MPSVLIADLKLKECTSGTYHICSRGSVIMVTSVLITMVVYPSLISGAVIKTHTKSNLREERIYLACTSRSHSPGTWRQVGLLDSSYTCNQGTNSELREYSRNQRKADCWLTGSCLTTFLIWTGPPAQGMVPFIEG